MHRATIPFRLRPTVTMAGVYGPGLVNNPRAGFSGDRWLPSGDTFWDGRTGTALTFLGGMPTLCAAGIVTSAWQRILSAAGLEAAGEALVYHDRDEYERIVAEQRRSGRRFVFQHVHPLSERSASDYWIKPELLAWLNDKASLDDLVPADSRPNRRVVPASDVPAVAAGDGRWPVVIKGTGPATSGGGFSVAIVPDAAALPQALAMFGPDELVVVEEFVEIRVNQCLNFATVDGRGRFLGGAAQITDDRGRFHGNWLGAGAEPPAEMVAVGHEILDRAMRLGYRGLAGFDMALDGRGAVRVLDLNFRINFSTPAVVWFPAIIDRMGDGVCGRTMRMEFDTPAATWWRSVVDLIRTGHFFPLSLFDPDPVRQSGRKAALHGIWLGQTQDAVERIRHRFLRSLAPASHAA
jgi:hypothetical protein